MRNCNGCQSGNGSYSLTQPAATRPIGYTFSTETNGNIVYYDYNGRLRFNYRFQYWLSYQRTTTQSVLVGYNNTDYSLFSNVNTSDQLEIKKPVTLEYSIDNTNWNIVDTQRENITQGSLSFEINNINSEQLFFRISDSGDSQNKIKLTGFQSNFTKKRSN